MHSPFPFWGSLLILLVLFDLVACAARPARPSQFHQLHYVFVDVGYEATFLYIYSWPSASTPFLRFPNETRSAPQPALHLFANNTAAIRGILRELLQFAMDNIPDEDQQHATPIYAMATSGLRLLRPTALSKRIMTTISEELKRRSPFLFKKAVVLNPTNEAVFGWIAVNYLFRTISFSPNEGGNPGPPETVGAVQIVGYCSHVTFDPPTPPLWDEVRLNLDFSIPAQSVLLYSHSYPHYGLADAFDMLARSLCFHGGGVPAQNVTRSVANPCLPVGVGRIVLRSPSTRVRCLMQPTGNPQKCFALIRDRLFPDVSPCPVGPCSFGGVYQPPLPSRLVVWISATDRFSLTELSGANQTLSLRELEVGAARRLATRVPTNESISNALAGFKLAYFAAFLRAIKVTHRVTFSTHSFVNRYGGSVSVSWPLGAVLYEASKEGKPTPNRWIPVNERMLAGGVICLLAFAVIGVVCIDLLQPSVNGVDLNETRSTTGLSDRSPDPAKLCYHTAVFADRLTVPAAAIPAPSSASRASGAGQQRHPSDSTAAASTWRRPVGLEMLTIALPGIGAVAGEAEPPKRCPLMMGYQFFSWTHRNFRAACGRQQLIAEGQLVPPIIRLTNSRRPSSNSLTEDAPLLLCDGDLAVRQSLAETYQAGPLRAVFLMINTYIGMGLPCMPYAVGLAGLSILPMLALLSLLSSYTAKQLLRAFGAMNVAFFHSVGGDTYANLAFSILGRQGQIAVLSLQTLIAAGLGVLCIQIVLQGFATLFPGWKLISYVVLSALILFPSVISPRIMKNALFSSGWSLQTLLILGSVLVMGFRYQKRTYPLLPIEFLGRDFSGGIGIALFAISGHGTLIAFRHAVHPQSRLEFVVNCSCAFVFVVHVVVAVAGYFVFRSLLLRPSTPASIILPSFYPQLGVDMLLTTVTWALLLVNALLGVPSTVDVLTGLVSDIAFPKWMRRSVFYVLARFVFLGLMMVVAAYTLSSFAFMCAFVGGVLCNATNFILPLTFTLVQRRSRMTLHEQVLHVWLLTICCGFFIWILCRGVGRILLGIMLR